MPRFAWRSVGAGVAATLLTFVAAEAALRILYLGRDRFVEAVPLPYRIGDDYGPIPPWFDSSHMLEPDARLLWRNRSGFHARYLALFVPFADDESRIRLVRRFSPSLPASLSAAPRWDVTLDSRGFRDGEFAEHKAPGTFRILCLGDSWTFGANVAQDDSYPRQLERLLARRYPAARFEVLNLGVLGYSSFQGKQLMALRAVDWDPDAVVVGFGMNDGRVAGYRDKDLASSQSSLASQAAAALEHVEVYKLLRYWALLVHARLPSTGQAFRAEAHPPGAAADYAALEAWTRVSLADYQANLREMIALGRGRGADVVLLDNEIDRGPYGEALERVAAEDHAALVHSDRLIHAAQSRIETELARRFELRTAGFDGGDGASGQPVRVVFRVSSAAAAVPHAMYVVGDQPALGDLVPNRVALHDDGTEGDEHAGDGVWSYAVSLPAGAVVHYAYTNSGREGVWEGLDVPAIRSFVVSGQGGTLYRPVESFGSVYLQSDSWHTDAAGLGEIARAVLGALENEPGFARFLASSADSSATASSAAHSNFGG
ncbi:MAG TPA: GDSL-type esterase/lipase family protein [Candidatus Binatia bacterium]|nr:GDSL-type esterase/lipase family protein [Candidatus Binatia bacterium]